MMKGVVSTNMAFSVKISSDISLFTVKNEHIRRKLKVLKAIAAASYQSFVSGVRKASTGASAR